MIIRRLEDSHLQGRTISAQGWVSHRLLLQDDKVGFSFHITYIAKGAVLDIHYQHHIESVYCIGGQGEIIDIENCATYAIRPGTIYVLNEHDKHRLTAYEDMQLACVFNPPLLGHEVHNEAGAYELCVQHSTVKSY